MLLLFGSMALLFLLGVPLAYGVGISSMIWLVASGSGVPLTLVVHRTMTGLDNFTLLAIPLFMIAGKIMNQGGIAKRLIDFADALVGHLKGGLAHINVVVSMLFAGMTASAAADTSAIGSILIPSMIDNGYDTDATVAVTAISSVIGIIIPPSITAVIYAITAEVSVGKLLLAGIIPGILLGLAQMGATAYLARKRGWVPYTKFSTANVVKSLKRAFLPMGTVLIVVGGIYGGIFTPTEAGVAAVVYAFILVKFVYKSLKWRDLVPMLVDTAVTGSLGLFLVTTSTIFSWIMAREQVPAVVFRALTSITTNPTLIILLIIAALLIVGTFLDSLAAIIILVPILQPIALQLGMDPIHFGAMVVLALGLGLATPPVGVCLFVACGIAKCKVSEIFGALLPYFLACLVVLLLVAFIPQLSLFIPSLMG
jgi:C4-dicarboxylate transporter DctM subunit